MKAISLTFAAALLVGGAALSGCAKDGLELTPEQEAEIDQSTQDSKKRGWIDIPPVPGSEPKGAVPPADAKAAQADADAFEGADLPPSEIPPTE